MIKCFFVFYSQRSSHKLKCYLCFSLIAKDYIRAYVLCQDLTLNLPFLNLKTAQEATKCLKDKKIPLVTTDCVFDEAVTIIRMKVGHKEAVNFGNSLLKSKVVNMVEISKDLKKEAWRIFVKYKDHRFSYTDCTSFAVLQRMKINRVFGYDKDFESMYFILFP